MERIRTLEDVLRLVAVNPELARAIKDDPQKLAASLGVELNDEEAQAISQNLDLDLVLEAAEAVDSMAQKVAQGIGLPRGRGSSAG